MFGGFNFTRASFKLPICRSLNLDNIISDCISKDQNFTINWIYILSVLFDYLSFSNMEDDLQRKLISYFGFHFINKNTAASFNLTLT